MSGEYRPRPPRGKIRLRPNETWTSERLANLRLRWWRGESRYDLARVFDCNVETVARKAANYGFRRAPGAPRRQPPQLSPADLDEMRQMWEAGDATWFIAERFDRTPGGVASVARRRSWRRPEGYLKGRLDADRWIPSASQAAWLSENWRSPEVTLFDMEAHLGVHRDTIARAAKRLGLPQRMGSRLHGERQHARVAKRDQTIVKLWNAGVEPDLIADQFWLGRQGVIAVLARARRRGEKVRRRSVIWKPGPDETDTIRQGYRLGIHLKTIAAILGAPWTCSIACIHKTATRLGLVHRNRTPQAMGLLSPENLLAYERSEGDPVERVQWVYTISRQITVAHALRALRDYREALQRFPQIAGIEHRLRVIRPVKPWRKPSARIEAFRSTARCGLRATTAQTAGVP